MPINQGVDGGQLRLGIYGRLVRWFGIGALLATVASAFPPAPHYTVFGNVRDEFGTLLPDAGGTVVFYKGGSELARNPIATVDAHDYNYQIRLKLDMGRAGTATYTSLASNPGSAFTIAVEIGGVLNYPIEVITARTVGNPADRHRLDLTLGEDTDGDGMPDAWEQQKLFYAHLPIEDLWRVTPDGDLTGDGIANVAQYVALTYGSDVEESFFLNILEMTTTQATLEFFTLTNKRYHLEKSTDLVNWAPVAFRVGQDAEAVLSYTATGVGVRNCYVEVQPSETKVFYRLGLQ
jgi:hypothetical protein